MKAAFAALLLALPQDSPEEQVRRLADEDASVRDRATGSLRALGESALPALRKATADPDPEIRARAGELLRRLEWEPALDPHLLARYPALRDAFDRGHARGVLDFAVQHRLWTWSFREKFEAFAVKLLDSPDRDLRNSGIGILTSLPEHAFFLERRPVRPLVRLISEWTPEGDDRRFGLGSLGRTAARHVSPLDRELLAATHAAAPDAALVLGLLREEAGIEKDRGAVVRVLKDGPDWAVDIAFAVARRARIGEARPALLGWIYRDRGWQAQQALAEFADASCREGLVAHLRRTPAAQQSWLVLQMIAKTRATEAVPILIELLRDTDDNRVTQVAETLAALGAPEAFEPLFDRVRVPDKAYVFARLAASVADAKGAERLLHLFECASGQTRFAIGHWLCAVRDPAAQQVILREFETEERPDVRKILFEAVTSYWFLKEGGGTGVEETLERLVRSPGDPLHGPAMEVLLRMKGREAVPLVEDVILGKPAGAGFIPAFLSAYPSERLLERAASLQAWEYVEALGGEQARLAAQRALASETSAAHRPRAAVALLRLGGRGIPELEWETPVPGGREFPSFLEESDLVELDLPGARDSLRRRVREKGVGECLWTLQRWAPPETAPDLRKILGHWDEGIESRIAEEDSPRTCGFGLMHRDWSGPQALRALGTTDDRSLLPLFLERLRGPEPELQQIAADVVGRWRAKEAVPDLRRLVRSAAPHMRAEALRALARIAAPETAEFIQEQLRDNPHAAPAALARMGVDARAELKALLADGRPAGPIAGALDLMANPRAYARIDDPLPLFPRSRMSTLPALVERVTGTPARFSPGARAAIRSHEDGLPSLEARTLRDLFEAIEGMQGYAGEKYTHLYRNGSIEICLAEEALAHWTSR